MKIIGTSEKHGMIGDVKSGGDREVVTEETRDSRTCARCCWARYYTIPFLLIFVVSMVGSILGTWFVLGFWEPAKPESPNVPVHNIEPRIDIPHQSDDGVRLVERNEWFAEPSATKMDALEHPVPYVIISHTASDFCPTQSECTFRVRFIQMFHIESRGWSDIAYNFLVGGDGRCYVGRGWNSVGAHAYGYNNRSIGISFIGTFNSIVPPKSQLDEAQKLIKLGVQSGYIAPNYKLLGHRQVFPTLSPGDALYDIIKTWPHWSPNPWCARMVCS